MRSGKKALAHALAAYMAAVVIAGTGAPAWGESVTEFPDDDFDYSEIIKGLIDSGGDTRDHSSGSPAETPGQQDQDSAYIGEVGAEAETERSEETEQAAAELPTETPAEPEKAVSVETPTEAEQTAEPEASTEMKQEAAPEEATEEALAQAIILGETEAADDEADWIADWNSDIDEIVTVDTQEAAASSASGTVNGVNWSIEDGVLTLDGDGIIPSSWDVPDTTITEVRIGEDVSFGRKGVFSACSALETIQVSNYYVMSDLKGQFTGCDQVSHIVYVDDDGDVVSDKAYIMDRKGNLVFYAKQSPEKLFYTPGGSFSCVDLELLRGAANLEGVVLGYSVKIDETNEAGEAYGFRLYAQDRSDGEAQLEEKQIGHISYYYGDEYLRYKLWDMGRADIEEPVTVNEDMVCEISSNVYNMSIALVSGSKGDLSELDLGDAAQEVTRLELTDGIERMNLDILSAFPKLKELYVSSSLEMYSASGSADSESLKEIRIFSGQAEFTNGGGVLDPDGKLIFYAKNSDAELLIDHDLKTLDLAKLRGAVNLKTVVLPSYNAKIIDSDPDAGYGDDFPLIRVMDRSGAEAFCEENGVPHFSYYYGDIDKFYKYEVTGMPVAAAGSCGEDAYFELGTNGILTISGTGPMTGLDMDVLGPLADQVEGIWITDGITGAPAGTFSAFARAKALRMSDGVDQRAFAQAFAGCTGLEEVDLFVDYSFYDRTVQLSDEGKSVFLVWSGSPVRFLCELNDIPHKLMVVKEWPVTTVSAFDTGTLADDGFRFANSRSSFGYSDSYTIPLEQYYAVYGKSKYAQILYQIHPTWNGNCFGMSSAVELLYYGNLDEQQGLYLTDFAQGEDELSSASQLTAASEYVPGAVSLGSVIERLQVSQFCDVIQSDYQTYKGQLQEICDEAKGINGVFYSKPFIISMVGPDGRNGHAVVAYAYVDNKDGTAAIYVYDSNFPDKAHIIRVRTDADGAATGWSYTSSSGETWGSGVGDCWITMISAEHAFYIWNYQGRLSNRGTMAVTNAGSFEIRKTDGTLVAKVEDGKLTWSDGQAYMGLIIGGDGEDENNYLYLPEDGEYRIVTAEEESWSYVVTAAEGMEEVSDEQGETETQAEQGTQAEPETQQAENVSGQGQQTGTQGQQEAGAQAETQAQVTAVTAPAKAAVSVIKVTPKKKAQKAKKVSMKKGTKRQISVKKKKKEKVTFKSSKPSVVSVSKKGVIKARKKGKASITIRVGKKKAVIKVTVKK